MTTRNRCKQSCYNQYFVNQFFLIGFVLFFAISVFSSCTEGAKKHGIKQGYIEYDITYNDLVPSKYGANMRPTKMVVKFKDNNTINRIEGLSGAFSFAFIQNMQTQTTYTLIKILNKKLYHLEPIDTVKYPFAYADMPNFTIQKTGETEKFLGFLCYRARVVYADTLYQPFEILYTKEIGVQNPNWNTPFEGIDGIMLKFSAVMFNQNMNIVASVIKSTKISDEDFIIPPDYEKVEQSTVEDVITLLK